MKHPASDKPIQEIIARLTRLEKAIFNKKEKRVVTAGKEDFAGPRGGVRLLITKNFFNAKKTFGEARSALAKNGYHYSRQAVQMALKGLATRKGPLTVLREGGSNHYVLRK